jgi:hypothetical protein
VEWCILIGNDFTGTDNFPRNFFSPLPDMNPLRKISDEDEDEDREDDDDDEEEEEVQEEGEGGTYEDENGDCDAGLDKKVSETRECMYVCMHVCFKTSVTSNHYDSMSYVVCMYSMCVCSHKHAFMYNNFYNIFMYVCMYVRRKRL